MSEKLNNYFNGDELASSVWKSKYAMKGEITPDDMHLRMAKEFARIEDKYQIDEYKTIDIKSLSEYGQYRPDCSKYIINQLFKDFKYIVPQGRVQAGLGIKSSYRSLSNCLRLPPPRDSYSSIMYTDTMLVSAAKRGCGYGLGISNIRPKETNVKNASSTSTGIVPFMERYSNSTREVGQDGRRGACLLDIDINHPDSLDFIKIKQNLTKVTGANISVKLNKEFINAVENDEDYILRFPCTEPINYNKEVFDKFEYNKLYKTILDDPKSNISILYTKKIKAKEYWNELIKQARNNAEPGVFFMDVFIDYSPSNVYKRYFEEGTNACGEQPMAVYDTCRLMLLNLFSYIDNPFTDKAKVNYKKLKEHSYEQQRLLDNLVDLEIESIDRIIEKIINDPEPLEEKQIELTLWKNVRKMAIDGRRTGCGITALGDMLAGLGVKYDSDEALEITDKVMKTKMQAELNCSIDLAILRGPFNGWDKNLEYEFNDSGEPIKGKNSFYQMLLEEFPEEVFRMCIYGRRNVNWSTIAPGGSVSIETQTTSGCEPLFMPFYKRRKKINPNDKESRVDFVDDNGDKWQEYFVIHEKFKQWMIKNPELWAKGIDSPLKVKDGFKYSFNKETLEKAFKASPYYGSTANDIKWEKRLKMQEVLQKYTTSAISSTLNLAEDTTEAQVSEIYLTASKMNLKGITVYREGSRSGVLVDSNKKDKEIFEQTTAPKRTKNLLGHSYVTKVTGEDFTVIVGLIDNKPYEIFAYKGRGQHDVKGEIVKNKKKSYSFISDKETNITNNLTDEQEAITRGYSFGLRHGGKVDFAVEQLNKTKGDLTSFNKAMARVLSKFTETKEVGNCPECKTGKLIMQEGCKKCDSCTYSAC